MYFLEISLLVIGFVMLVVGYRKSNRNLLSGAALVLLGSGALPDLVRGMERGVLEAQ